MVSNNFPGHLPISSLLYICRNFPADGGREHHLADATFLEIKPETLVHVSAEGPEDARPTRSTVSVYAACAPDLFIFVTVHYSRSHSFPEHKN